jgi:putative DNA primase/helicase
MDRPKTYDEVYGGSDDGTVAGTAKVASIGEAGKRTSKAEPKKKSEGGASWSGRVLPSPKQPVDVAQVLVDENYANGDLLLRSWRGGFWVWDGPRWMELEARKLHSDAIAFTRNAVYIGSHGPEPWAPDRHKIANLLDALRGITYLREGIHPPDWTEPHPHAGKRLVGFTNGLLDVETRELHGHDPRYFNITAVPFAYEPEAPAPKKWLRFLKELWPNDSEAIEALQEYFGYIISGDTTQHKILLLVGPRRGGKGTIARISKSLVGEGNYAGPTLASLATNFGLAPLIGKPLAIVSDARLGGANVHQVVERLLSISGEDMLTIDRKYKEHWTGTLPTRFIIISNELPRFGDASGAIASRFILLTLTESWLGRENTALTDELLTELPGIMNWALDGLERLQTRGRFTDVTSSEDALGALQDLVSPVAAFVRECCDVGPYEVSVEAIYQKWKLWAEDNGHRVASAQTFGRDLRAVIPGLRTVRHRDADRARFYQGVRLRGPLEDASPGTARDTPADASPSRSVPRSNPLWDDTEDHVPDHPDPVETDTCDLCGQVPCTDWCGARP